ncbi:hypothetical protein [Shewanella colwelliana]|uniref:hypothetical protein n=1 Tax=Shewanella colwelliana TaxID=23 RepID=UPI001C7D730B|nr:hypothetical protein [Shewanella colwelliana]
MKEINQYHITLIETQIIEHTTINEQLVSDFKDYVLERLENINLIESPDQELQKKLLYMAYLDSLAGARYPSKRNKKAFISVIKDYSTWEHSDRICPLALKKLSDKHPQYTELKGLTKKAYNQMVAQGGKFGAAQVNLHGLPSKDELDVVWPQDWNDDPNSPNRENLTQIIQLYNCRNSLVHSFQHRKESPYPRRNSNVIHYRQYMRAKGDSIITDLKHDEFELVHPIQFLYKLCTEVTLNMTKFFLEEETNPFERYYDDFGRY